VDSRAAFEKALGFAQRLDTKWESWTNRLGDTEDSPWTIELFGKVLAMLGDTEVLYICGSPRVAGEGAHEIGADLVLVTQAAVIMATIERVLLDARVRHKSEVTARPRAEITKVDLINATGLNTDVDIPWPAVLIAEITFSDGTILTIPNSKYPKSAAPDNLRELIPALIGGM